MSTASSDRLPRHPRAVRALVMAFGLSLVEGCNVELFGRPPIWMAPTQHPVGHLLVFVTAMVVVVLLVAAISELVLWIAGLVGHRSHPRGWRSHPQRRLEGDRNGARRAIEDRR